MEDEIIIKVNKAIFNNLQVFLSRVKLDWNEVPASVEIMNALLSAEKDKKEKDVV